MCLPLKVVRGPFGFPPKRTHHHEAVLFRARGLEAAREAGLHRSLEPFFLRSSIWVTMDLKICSLRWPWPCPSNVDRFKGCRGRGSQQGQHARSTVSVVFRGAGIDRTFRLWFGIVNITCGERKITALWHPGLCYFLVWGERHTHTHPQSPVITRCSVRLIWVFWKRLGMGGRDTSANNATNIWCQ